MNSVTGVLLLAIGCAVNFPAIAADAVEPADAAVTAELSRRSAIPEAELQTLLADCNANQMSMNLCAFRDFVAADLELRQAVARRRDALSEACRAKLDLSQAHWAGKRDSACTAHAKAEAGGGSMQPMMEAACKADMTRERVTRVEKFKQCRDVR